MAQGVWRTLRERKYWQTGAGMWSRAMCLCVVYALVASALSTGILCAQQVAAPADDAKNPAGADCFRAPQASVVPEPEDLRSSNGTLDIALTFRGYVDASGEKRYCYVSASGGVSPTLRVLPGDTLILRLKNEAPTFDAGTNSEASMRMSSSPGRAQAAHAHGRDASARHDACGPMSASSTNLHFHGLAIPAACHQDETLKTRIEPKDPPFEYRFQIPEDQPPGMYWYHPHVHGFGKTQILGGASGALIVEGIERANPQLAGLPERVFVVRDENLVNPNAEPPPLSLATQLLRRDPEGDAMNTGTGEGKPAKDLSINYVPVPYPTYPPALIGMRPLQRELWRVANASAITYLNLQVLYNSAPQPLEVVALDGAPLGLGGAANRAMMRVSHVVLPPGGRVEFVLNGPPAGVAASLVTNGVDTGPMGENDPRRALAILKVSKDAPLPRSLLAANRRH
jgi:FtsP/CotA-like multicopper oxidase with cupredoxin domain